jgi:hypothetical protein
MGVSDLENQLILLSYYKRLMMLYYMENTCVCTNNARKFNDQKRILQKNSIEQSLEKCLQEENSKLKQNILKTKFFTFFRII